MCGCTVQAVLCWTHAVPNKKHYKPFRKALHQWEHTWATGRQERQLLEQLGQALIGLQRVPLRHQEAEGSCPGGFCQAAPVRHNLCQQVPRLQGLHLQPGQQRLAALRLLQQGRLHSRP